MIDVRVGSSIEARSNAALLALAVLIWAGMVAVALALRPALPPDELRYLSVAWEMWSNGNFVVPTLNGDPYSHKPPLLFWLIHLGWAVFGVSETWARLVSPLAGLVSIGLAAGLARRLWPEQLAARGFAPLLLAGGGGFALYATLTYFDTLVSAATLLGLIGAIDAWRAQRRGERAWSSWLVYGAAIGLGGLAKGPVILLHLLPVALLAPLWGEGKPLGGWRRHYGGIGLGVLVGFAIALGWAIPAAVLGGPEYRAAIFWGQTAGRVAESFAHARPFWWYLPVAAAMLLPWLIWPRAWRMLAGMRPLWRADEGVRFCAVWIVVPFVVFSLISGKQPHYLLPLIPGAMLLIARAIDPGEVGPGRAGRFEVLPTAMLVALLGLVQIAIAGLPEATLVRVMRVPPFWLDSISLWMGALFVVGAAVLLAAGRWLRPLGRQSAALALAMPLALGLVHAELRPAIDAGYNLAPVARYLARVEAEGRAIALVGENKGLFHFLGRLKRPVDEIESADELAAFIKAHPEGVVVDFEPRARAAPSPDPAEFRQGFRNRWIVVRRASDVAAAAVGRPAAGGS